MSFEPKKLRKKEALLLCFERKATANKKRRRRRKKRRRAPRNRNRSAARTDPNRYRTFEQPAAGCCWSLNFACTISRVLRLYNNRETDEAGEVGPPCLSSPRTSSCVRNYKANPSHCAYQNTTKDGALHVQHVQRVPRLYFVDIQPADERMEFL